MIECGVLATSTGLSAEVADVASEIDGENRPAAFALAFDGRRAPSLRERVGLIDESEDVVAFAVENAVDRLGGVVLGVLENVLDAVTFLAAGAIDQPGW